MVALYFFIGAISFTLNQCDFIKVLDLQSLDKLYSIRGEKPLSPKIELICIDKKTIAQIGRPPYPAELLHEVLTGIDQLGARVIGVEIDNFLNHDGETSAKTKGTVVLGLTKSCFGALSKKSRNQTVSQSNPFPCEWAFFPGMLDSSNCHFAHLCLESCEAGFSKHCVPFFLKKNDFFMPPFAFSLYKYYHQLEKRQIVQQPGKIRVNFDSSPSLNIPLVHETSIPVIYLGQKDSVNHSRSFVDVLECVRNATEKSTAEVRLSRYWNKIVLIGSQVEDSGYHTPFSSDVSPIFLQATLLSNLLENRFLHQTGQALNSIAYGIVFLLILLLTFKTKTLSRLFYSFGLLILLVLLQIVAFVVLDFFMPLWGIILFVFLAVAVSFIFENNWDAEVSPENYSGRQKTAVVEDSVAKIFTDPFVRVVILLGREKKNVNLTHTLETEQDCISRLSAFHRSPQSKNPYIISSSKLNRLSAETKRLGEIYYNYCQREEKEVLKPIELIKRIGGKVYHEFGLSKTFTEIFELERKPLYLNLVINDPTIPWQWAYDSRHDAFLCDRFPLSFSFAIEKADLKNFNVRPKAEMPLGNQKATILLHGNWRGHPGRALNQVDQEIASIKRRMHTEENLTIASCTDPDEFLSKLDTYIRSGINLRVIHYSGHIEDNQMEIGDGLYLRAGTLSQARNLYFYSRPVVFLNGCHSGHLGYLWDKYDDLATEFLACGAAACIITNFDIIETSARKISETFYYFFLSEGLSVGEALRKTRVKLSQPVKSEVYDPDYDITRYFYSLYGDPTVRF